MTIDNAKVKQITTRYQGLHDSYQVHQVLFYAVFFHLFFKQKMIKHEYKKTCTYDATINYILKKSIMC